jgi:hypothetical protein
VFTALLHVLQLVSAACRNEHSASTLQRLGPCAPCSPLHSPAAAAATPSPVSPVKSNDTSCPSVSRSTNQTKRVSSYPASDAMYCLRMRPQGPVTHGSVLCRQVHGWIPCGAMELARLHIQHPSVLTLAGLGPWSRGASGLGFLAACCELPASVSCSADTQAA